MQTPNRTIIWSNYSSAAPNLLLNDDFRLAAQDASTENSKVAYITPYLINMENLFELYARSLLKRKLSNTELELVPYGEIYSLIESSSNNEIDRQQTHLINHCIPDIVVRNRDSRESIAVLDAKYKPRERPDRNDSHRLLSYTLLLGVDKCGFIFPDSAPLADAHPDLDSLCTYKLNIEQENRARLYFEMALRDLYE